MNKRITLSIDEIFVTHSWLSNACSAADETPNKTIAEGVVRKLGRHLGYTLATKDNVKEG